MESALRAVQDGTKVNQAARDYGVPLTTLKDRVSGRVIHGTLPGPKAYLNQAEEEELGTFLLQCSRVGYGKTKKDVLRIVESVANEKGVLRKSKITDGWFRRFLERQSHFSLRKGDSTAHVRMDAINAETLHQYFSLLQDTLKEHGLMDKPHQIYNVDESGIPFDHKTPNVITEKNVKKVRYRTSGRKGQVTIVACASAAGQVIPPMIIFDAKNLQHAWTKGEVPGTKYGLSEKGWINCDLFEGWLAEHFLQHAVSSRPLLLLLDGHSTHFQPEVVRYARKHDVIMLCLPPHTTHES